MKIKTIIVTILCLSISLSLFGCGKEDKVKSYEYDLTQYVKLGEYKGIKYSPTEVIDVTEDAIMNEIYSAIESNNLMQTTEITDRPAQLGDTLNIDYEGLLDGVAFEGGTATGADLTLGSGQFIDGFEDGLVGAKVGESLALNLNFPDPYPNNTELSGKAVVFNVTVNSITNTSYPEITDELVSQISDYSTLNDYKAYIKSYLESEIKESANDSDRNAVWTKVTDNTTIIDYPQTEVQFYYDNIYDYYESYAANYNMTLEDYVAYYGDTLDSFKEYCTETAKTTVKNDMIAVAIYRNENLKISDEDYSFYTSYLDKYYGCTKPEETIELLGSEEIYNAQVIYFYVLDYIMDNATKQ